MMFPFFETDFAIGKGQAAFVFSCSQLLAFLTAPIAGALAEKLGPRVVVGGGLLLLAAGLRARRWRSRIFCSSFRME